jgi:hypothetical protein
LPVGWTPEKTFSTKAILSFLKDPILGCLFRAVVCHAGAISASGQMRLRRHPEVRALARLEG